MKPPQYTHPASTAPLRLELQDITKVYPGTCANDGVSLELAPGEIHALLGENGAGKSTLMKIVYGAVQPDSGRMIFDGQVVRVTSPEHARILGIAMVFQHSSLFETLTVAENVWLGLRGTSKLELTARIREAGERYGLAVDPLRPVHTLSLGERQRVEIVRALLSEPRLLILDEPTSVLTPQAVEALFEILRRIASEGCSILYVSHKLDEIRALCDRCTVLRGGRVTGMVRSPALESNASLARLMLGAEPPRIVHQRGAPGDVVLEVNDLHLQQEHEFGVSLDGISLRVSAGEVVGVAGVSGNGQNELLAALSGEDRRSPNAAIRLFGRQIGRASPLQRRRLGLHFVPEERLGRATVPVHSLARNLLLTRSASAVPRWFVERKPLWRLAGSIIERFRVHTPGPGALARSLSGGNLQKYVVGREIDARPKLLIVSQPTWGVDVGAAAQIHGELLELRDSGSALLIVSEDLDELFELCDSLIVIAKGRVSPRIARPDATRSLIGEWMSGLWPNALADQRGLTCFT